MTRDSFLGGGGGFDLKSHGYTTELVQSMNTSLPSSGPVCEYQSALFGSSLWIPVCPLRVKDNLYHCGGAPHVMKISVTLFTFGFNECFKTTFLHTHSWLNWVDEDDWWGRGWLEGKTQKTLYTSTITLMGCVCLFVCWSLTSLCHSNGHIETMPAREINPFTALTRIRSQFLRTQWSTSNHSEWTRLRVRPLSHRGWHWWDVG